MGKFDIIGGAGITAAPLINFDCIIDEDISLIRHVIKDIKNYNVFDYDKLIDYKKTAKLIGEIYHAAYTNPLYFLMIDDSHKEFLDQCYSEFMSEPYFLKDYAVATDVYNMVELFINSGEIVTTIVYKNEQEKQLIEDDDILSKANKIYIEDVNLDFYSQIYLNRIEDASRYMDKTFKRTFYFSSRGSNLTEDKTELKESDILSNIGAYNNLSVFDMYRQDVIGRSIY